MHARRMSSESRDGDKKDIQKKLEEKLAQTQARGEELAEKEADENNRLQDIIKIIRRMYEELGCAKLINTADLFQCDNNGAPILTENTLMQFLGVVEQRATELILRKISEQAVAADDPKDIIEIKITTTSPLGLGPATPVGASLVKVVPPKIETEDKSGDEKSDDDGDDDDSRPMTQVCVCVCVCV